MKNTKKTKEYTEGCRVAFLEASCDCQKVAMDAFAKGDDAAAMALRDFAKYLMSKADLCLERD